MQGRIHHIEQMVLSGQGGEADNPVVLVQRGITAELAGLLEERELTQQPAVLERIDVALAHRVVDINLSVLDEEQKRLDIFAGAAALPAILAEE